MTIDNLDTTKIFIQCLFSFLSLYTFHLILNLFLDFDRAKKKYILASCALFFIVTEILVYINTDAIINLILSVIGLFLISLFYKSNIIHKVVYSVSFVIFMSMFEILILNAYSVITGVTTELILEHFSLTFYLSALSKTIPFIVVKIYSITKKDSFKKNSVNVSIITIMQLLAIPLISVVILQIAISMTRYDLHNLSIIITFCIVLINILFLNLYEKVNLMAEEKIKNAVLNNQIDYYLSLYENLKTERMETLRLKHNIKNNTIKIRTLLEENEVEKIFQEIEYILDTNNTTIEVFSQIPIIDAIINYKMQLAKKYDINITSEITLDKDVYINYSDMTNILGNALDNAIEACRKNLDKNNKIINLQIHQKQDNIYIGISNPYEESINFKNGFPLSSKRKNEYGIGLKTIEKIINDKNNIMNMDTLNNIFKLEIVIFSMSK